jgi:hypothetical protein
MEKLVVVRREGLKVFNHFNGDLRPEVFAGRKLYRAVAKCQAGYLWTSEVYAHSPIEAFRRYNSKALQSLEFVTESGSTITLYARMGKKVWAAEQLLIDMEVRDINQDLGKTALYSQAQYEVVNAKNWAAKAFQVNVIN